MKQLQMVKEVSWDFVYQNVYSDILRNAVATYIVEVLQQTMQPEPHPELFYLIEDTFKQLDKGGPSLVGNLPIYFLIHLSQTMGFGLQGKYSPSTPVLDVREGQFGFLKRGLRHAHLRDVAPRVDPLKANFETKK